MLHPVARLISLRALFDGWVRLKFSSDVCLYYRLAPLSVRHKNLKEAVQTGQGSPECSSCAAHSPSHSGLGRAAHSGQAMEVGSKEPATSAWAFEGGWAVDFPSQLDEQHTTAKLLRAPPHLPWAMSFSLPRPYGASDKPARGAATKGRKRCRAAARQLTPCEEWLANAHAEYLRARKAGHFSGGATPLVHEVEQARAQALDGAHHIDFAQHCREWAATQRQEGESGTRGEGRDQGEKERAGTPGCNPGCEDIHVALFGLRFVLPPHCTFLQSDMPLPPRLRTRRPTTEDKSQAAFVGMLCRLPMLLQRVTRVNSSLQINCCLSKT